MMTRLVLASVLLMLAARAGYPGEPDPAEINAIFKRWDRKGTPGCALGVIRGGKLAFARGYGLANLEYAVPIKPDTVFHVASVSKQFTCFAIALLAAEGKLSLDDAIRKHVPEVPDFGHRITLRHLMHHTSGLRDQWDLLVLAGWRMEDVITHDDVMELVRRQKQLNFAPGTRYLYCNTGYTLLAAVVKRVSGRSLRRFTQVRIFKPLGMKNTRFHESHQRIVPNRAYCYGSRQITGLELYHKIVLSYSIVGATSLFTTVEDLALWQENLASGRVGGPEVKALMVSRGALSGGKRISYGLGLMHGRHRGLRTIGHGGGDAGFRCHLVRFPNHDLSVAVLGNHARLPTAALALRVADLYLKGARPVEAPAAREEHDVVKQFAPPAEPPALAKESLEALVGTWVDESTGDLVVTRQRRNALQATIGRRRVALTPVTNRRFAVTTRGPLIGVAFSDGKSGKHLTTHARDGSTTRFRAVPPSDATPDYLAQLAGRYHSDELDVAREIVQRGSNLYVLARKYGRVRLRPQHRDGYVARRTRFRFTRDEHDRVTGFLLSTGRVKNLRFRRLPPGQ